MAILGTPPHESWLFATPPGEFLQTSVLPRRFDPVVSLLLLLLRVAEVQESLALHLGQHPPRRFNRHDTVRLLENVDAAGGWRPYVAARRLQYVLIRNHVSNWDNDRAETENENEDRKLYNLLFGALLPPSLFASIVRYVAG